MITWRCNCLEFLFRLAAGTKKQLHRWQNKRTPVTSSFNQFPTCLSTTIVSGTWQLRQAPDSATSVAGFECLSRRSLSLLVASTRKMAAIKLAPTAAAGPNEGLSKPPNPMLLLQPSFQLPLLRSRNSSSAVSQPFARGPAEKGYHCKEWRPKGSATGGFHLCMHNWGACFSYQWPDDAPEKEKGIHPSDPEEERTPVLRLQGSTSVLGVPHLFFTKTQVKVFTWGATKNFTVKKNKSCWCFQFPLQITL